MKDRSTDAALYQHTFEITESIDRNNKAIGIYLDLAKAFDTVNHSKLVKQLKKIGIEGHLLQWYNTYLRGRVHCVKLQTAQRTVYSKELKSGFGVPQGSVLGPVLFNVYINDLLELPLRGSVVGYADDTSMLYSSDTGRLVPTCTDHLAGHILDTCDAKTRYETLRT